jgi:hypothetical protein
MGALIGSIVLLVATSATMINKRSELRSEQDGRVGAAALAATQSAVATVDRALAVVDVAAAAPADESTARVTEPWADATLAALTESFDNATGCVITTAVEQCTGGSLLVSDAYERALRLSTEAGRSMAVADPSTDSVIVVDAGSPSIALRIPADSLVPSPPSGSSEAFDASTTVTVGVGTTGGVVGPETIDGSRVVVTSVLLPADGGTIIVRSSVVDDAGLFGQNFALYAALLGLGTVLIALAGVTFLA